MAIKKPVVNRSSIKYNRTAGEKCRFTNADSSPPYFMMTVAWFLTGATRVDASHASPSAPQAFYWKSTVLATSNQLII